MPRMLIIEDEVNARKALGEVFSTEHEVTLVEDAEAAQAFLDGGAPDVVLTDVVLPGDEDGLDILRRVKRDYPSCPVLVMTAYGSVGKAVDAMRDGAHDFLEKPLDLKRLRAVVASALRSSSNAPTSEPYRKEIAEAGVPPGFVGEHPRIKEIFRVVAKAAPTNATVLIVGESGTGKELVARAIHHSSPRTKGPYIKVNCAALPESLLEGELFGHVKGAFTGAMADRAGRFEAASGGTLFLDEVGEIPPHTQVKLLRVLQTREVERLGESKSRAIDVRLVAATNADLDAMVKKGTLREDFYFRLKVITVRMPALRERRSDIPLLVNHFVSMYGERHGRDAMTVSDGAMDVMTSHDWPGNVRELENTIEAAVVLAERETITPDVLPEEIGGAQRVEDLPTGDVIVIPAGTPLPDAERTVILDTLRRTGGNKTAAARILGIGLRTLYRKLEQYEQDGDTGASKRDASAD